MKYRKVLAAVLCVCLVFAFAFGAERLSKNQPSQTDTPDSSTDTEASVQPVTPETPTQTETVVRNTDPVRSNPDSDGKTVRFYLALPREIVENDLYTFYITPEGQNGGWEKLSLTDGHLHVEETLRETAEHKYDFYLFLAEAVVYDHKEPLYDLRAVTADGMDSERWQGLYIADTATVVRVAPSNWMLWEDDQSRNPKTGAFFGLSAVRYGKYYVSVEQRTLPCSDCPAEWSGLEQYTDCSTVYTAALCDNFFPEVKSTRLYDRRLTFYRSSTSSGAWKTYISPEGAEDWVSIGIYSDAERVTGESCENSMNMHGQDWSMSRITVTFSQPVTTNLFEIKWVVEDESVEGAPYECAHWHNLRLDDTVLLREIYACDGWTDFPAANALIYEPVILCDECPEEWHNIRRN